MTTVLSILRSDVHRQVLALRAMDRLVQTRLFEEAFNIEKDHRDLLEAIEHGNVEWIDDWIERTIKLEIGELSMRELRLKAAQYRILRYTAMSKDQLIVSLTQAIHNAREAQTIARNVSSSEEGLSPDDSIGVRRAIHSPAGC